MDEKKPDNGEKASSPAKLDRKEVISIACAIVGTLCALASVPSAIVSYVNSANTEDDAQRAERTLQQVESLAQSSQQQAESINELADYIAVLTDEATEQSEASEASSESSQRSARASELMAEIARQQLDRQSSSERNRQARVELRRLGVNNLHQVGQQPLYLSMFVENTGPTPAIQARVSQHAVILPLGSRPQTSEQCVGTDTITVGNLNSLVETEVGGMTQWTSERLSEDLSQGNRGLFLYGDVCYRDQSGVRHALRYCAAVHKPSNTDGYAWTYC